MYSSSETAVLNAALGFLGTFWLLLVAFIVLNIIANWKIFTKAGQAGWASIIPFYNKYIEFKIYWGNGWLFLVPIVLSLLGFIPLIGTVLIVICIIINIMSQYKKAVAFGQSIGFTIGLILLNPIFNMILAFGQYKYFGIPQDGYSYDQMKVKYDNHKAEQQQHPTTYAQPAPEYNPNQNMNYQNPNAQPVAPQQAPVQPQAQAQQTSTVNMPQPPMQNDQNPNQ